MASKFTPEVRDTVLGALKQNPSLYSAAAAADITYPTLQLWLQKGSEGAEEYAEFLQEVELARACMKNEIMASLKEVACDPMHPQSVRAARELLTALYPKEFSSVKHTVVHEAKAEDDVDLSKIETGELRAFLRTLKKIRATNDEPRQPAVALVDVIAKKAGRSA